MSQSDTDCKIIEVGDPRLRIPAQTVVDFSTELLEKQLNCLFKVMKETQGAGLSAIQIGIPYQIFTYGFEHNPRYPHQRPIPESYMINPKVKQSSKELNVDYEGCLSVPGIRGQVPRAFSIDVEYQDFQGKYYNKHFDGFEARIIQHEIDHLNGIIFVERIKDLKSIMTTHQWLSQKR